jgi:transposase InsO family protein
MALVMTRQAAMMRLMDATITAGVKVGNVSEWCRVNGVGRRTFYRHKARIEAEGSWQPRSRRPKTSPGATPAAVAAEIVRLRGELAPDNGADAIIAALGPSAAAQDWAGQGWRVPHRSTVNKILKRAGLVTPDPRKRPRSSFRRFAYARPRDCYQVDATEVKLASGTAVTVFEALDDCTRLLAACQVADAETAAAAVAAIRAAAGAHGAPGIVLCDNGAAFTGGPRATAGTSAFSRAVAALGSRLIHSSPYHPQTCGKVERHHQTLKRWLAARPAPATADELQVLLDSYREHYNTRRHHTAVSTTPRQAWDNAASHGGPGRLPRQDNATVHHLTVAPNGAIAVGAARISVGKHRAGQRLTAIRDHGHVTVYTLAGQPIGHIRLDHDRKYQGTLTPAA